MSDSEYDEYRERMATEHANAQTDPSVPGIARDLETGQYLVVTAVVADDLVEYAVEEGLDLLNYKSHAYLPVRIDDSVYTCTYLSSERRGGWKLGDDYDFPRGRLQTIPIDLSPDDADEDSVDFDEAVVRAAADADEPADVDTDSGPGELENFDAGGDSA